jgi:glycerophosphoryl diester phosphodiesterase
VPTRLPARRSPPIGFAHRGARAHARENTLPAFVLARRLGATGLESDVWLSADDQVILDHDGVIGRVRKRPLRDIERVALPGHLPTLDELYTTCGTDYELSLDVKNADAAASTIAVAQRFGAAHRLWLCHPDVTRLREWRSLDPQIKLVHSTWLKEMRNGPERHAADLAAAQIDAVNLHVSEWKGGLTALFHRFDRYVLGWDAQFDRQLNALIDMGIDGVFSDHVDRMMSAIARYFD